MLYRSPKALKSLYFVERRFGKGRGGGWAWQPPYRPRAHMTNAREFIDQYALPRGEKPMEWIGCRRRLSPLLMKRGWDNFPREAKL